MPELLCSLPILKLLTLEAACTQRVELARQGKQVVLTNGCFDLLHAGHLYFLQEARALGDVLFVAINSDESVRCLKGPDRPVQSEKERAYALSALECTFTLFIFHHPRLADEIKLLRPDIYAKAGDYNMERLDVREREALEACNTRIVFLPFLEGFSTSGLIKRIWHAGGLD